MSRPVATSAFPSDALLALGRSLWQLAIVGVWVAIALVRWWPDASALALWCVLAPLSALATHYRHAIVAVARRTDRPARSTAAPRASRHPQALRSRAGARRRSERRAAGFELLGAALLQGHPFDR
jgi:hypothetical protein